MNTADQNALLTIALLAGLGNDHELAMQRIEKPFKDYLRTSINLLLPVAREQGLDAADAHQLFGIVAGQLGQPRQPCRNVAGLAKPLSRDDIRNLAAYLSSLPGPLSNEKR